MEKILEMTIHFLKTSAPRIVLAFAVLVAGSFVSKFLKKRLPVAKVFNNCDKSMASFLKNTILIAFRVFLIVTVLITLGMPATTFVTVLASAGVTIGLALQGSLSNLAGGIMIIFFRPYSVGDSIRAMNMEGRVKEISAFYTTLVTTDGTRVVLPNGSLNNSVIVNYTAENLRRIEVTLKLPAGMEETLAKNRIVAAAQAQKAVVSIAPDVLLMAENETEMTFRLYVWCRAADYEDAKLTIDNDMRKALEKLSIG